MEQPLKKNRRKPRVRNVIAFSSFIMLLIGIMVLYQAFREYDEAIEAGKRNAERLVSLLTDQVELTFLAVDLSLQRAADRQYLNMTFGKHLPDFIVNNFRSWVEETDQIVAMLLINESGQVELAVHEDEYKGWLDYGRSMENFPAYSQLRYRNDKDVFVGAYTSEKSDHSNLILMSRRLDKTNGGFAGVVVAAVKSRYFLDFFDSMDTGSQRYMSIMLRDGYNLFEDTQHVRNNNELFNQLRYHVMQPAITSNIQTVTENIEGEITLMSYRHLAQLPLSISVIIEEEDFLSAFWEERIKDMSFLAIFTVFGSVLSFFALTLAKQIARVEDSESAAILASQAKSEFLANMSHELRTPLNAIIGFSEMMNSGYFGPLNAKQKERMNDINLCGNHLLHLISDILEFSKGDAGRLELVEENVSIPEIVDEVKRMMGEKLKSKGINFIIDVAQNLPIVYADKRKLKQILINLVSNAAKFTPQDGDIKVTARMDGAGAMNIAVADTGIGIAEEDIPTALSVFGQVHRNKSHEGTGLGLPLCRMFAELHGGKLALASIVGEGTTVRIIFPASRIIRLEDLPGEDQDNTTDEGALAS